MKENERKQSAFPECSLFPMELGGPPGRLPFFLRRGANFFRMYIIPWEKRRAAQGTPASDPQEDCEGTARTSFVEKRDKYL